MSRVDQQTPQVTVSRLCDSQLRILIARLATPWSQPQIGSHRTTASEPSWVLQRQDETQCRQRSDSGDLTALRYGDWKAIFLEQKAENTLRAWIEPWTPLRVPLIFNLRRDPYERAYSTSNTYYDWLLDHVFFLVPAQAYVGQFLATFEEFPPRQKAASFSIDQVMDKLQTTTGSP